MVGATRIERGSVLLRHFICTVLLLLGSLGSSDLAFAQPQTHNVIVTDNFFSPANITINEGDEIAWNWEAEDPHNVHAGDIPGAPTTPYEGSFLSPQRITNFTYRVRFSREFLNEYPSNDGIYRYYCEPHFTMGMVGAITVVRPDKLFRAEPIGQQVVPPLATDRSAACSVLLNGNETYVDISCSHNLSGSVSGSLNVGTVTENGAQLCSINPGATTRCNLTRDQVEQLYSGDLYLLLSNGSQTIRGQIFVDGGSQSVSGIVRLANGVAVPGVTVAAGGISAVTNGSGQYQRSSVPNGYYTLTAVKSGYAISADPGTNPLFINGTSESNRNFTAVFDQASCVLDSDGDGVCDERELLDGSSPTDRGSNKDQLKSPIYVLWNGFIGIRNIVEMVNQGSSSGIVKVSLYDIDGVKVEERSFNLGARGQVDVILNSWTSFRSDSYGLATIEFGDSLAGAFDGRISYYRDASDGSGFEFAFSVPFVDPIRGRSSVAFNTFQPSLAATDAQHMVAQWLSIVNLDSVNRKRFQLRRFDISGVLLRSETIEVPPFGRIDQEAGHIIPGPSQVGLNEIIPEDSAAPYLAQLYRYGGNAPAGQAPTAYRFAFPLLARPGNGSSQVAPISTGGGAANWFEIANTLETPVNVALSFYNNRGGLVGQQTVLLNAHAQQHINAGALVPNGDTGSVRIVPSVPNSVIGQAMYYYRHPQSGGITGMYGTQIRESLGADVSGSYNLFIQMYNWLRLTNLRGSETSITLTVYTSAGIPTQRTIVLPANGGTDLGLHETSVYGTRLDDYGVVRLND